jgi:hypothetical protein
VHVVHVVYLGVAACVNSAVLLHVTSCINLFMECANSAVLLHVTHVAHGMHGAHTCVAACVYIVYHATAVINLLLCRGLHK